MSIESRVEKIEENLVELEKGVAEVKTYVRNHIPHMINDVRSDINAMAKKIKPLETKELKVQGVHEFLNLGLKITGLIGVVIWTALQIFDKLNWFGM